MLQNITLLIFLLQILCFSNCAVKQDRIKLTECEQCKFERTKNSEVLNYKSQPKSGSLEECFIRLYLFEEYEKYADYYEPVKVYPFLGIKGEGRTFLKDRLKFKLLFKFYFDKNGVNHCFTRWLITNEENDQMIFYTTFKKENHQWKALSSFDRSINAKMLRKLKTKHLEDLLTFGKSDTPALSALLTKSKDPKTGAINYQQLNLNFSAQKETMVQFNYEEKNYFPVAWLKKIWALYK